MVTGIPKIYVLTIPGTPRHMEAERQLSGLGVRYEFVYGRIWPEEKVPWAPISDIHKDIHSRYYARAWGAKEGHMRMVEKAIIDGEPVVLLCEDDLMFKDIDLNGLSDYCKRLDEFGGILHFRGCGDADDSLWFGRDNKGENGILRSYMWPGCSCIALTAGCLQFYLDGMRKHHCECDMAMCYECMETGRIIPAVAGPVSPVKWNMHFQNRSNIVGGYNPW